MKLGRLLDELKNNTYVMLQPSNVHGIGVFAIKKIPKGCRDIFSKPNTQNDEYIAISKAEVEQLPIHTRDLVENFCLYDDENYFVPEDGFKKLDLVIYLNHSDTPNLISINDGDYFEAIRDINVGEELFVDYGEIVE